jgi:hypothetical protein
MPARLRTSAAPAAAPPPPFGKISAASFRVEQQAEYHGEIKVPSILFMGKAGGTGKQSLKSELLKYKLRPGALEEIADEEEAQQSSSQPSGQPSPGGAAEKKKGVSFKIDYSQQNYGGTREIRSSQRQIQETETAAHESTAEAQRIIRQTQTMKSAVDEKTNFVKENNSYLDSELVEIERQIEELKRISRSQVDEIRNLKQANKQKSEALKEDNRELEAMEDSMKHVIYSEKEAALAESPAKADARRLRQKSMELDPKKLVESMVMDGEYAGDLADPIPQHDDLQRLVAANSEHLPESDAELVSEELATVQPWRSCIREPSDWSPVRAGPTSRPVANAPGSEALTEVWVRGRSGGLPRRGCRDTRRRCRRGRWSWSGCGGTGATTARTACCSPPRAASSTPPPQCALWRKSTAGRSGTTGPTRIPWSRWPCTATAAPSPPVPPAACAPAPAEPTAQRDAAAAAPRLAA